MRNYLYLPKRQDKGYYTTDVLRMDHSLPRNRENLGHFNWNTTQLFWYTKYRYFPKATGVKNKNDEK